MSDFSFLNSKQLEIKYSHTIIIYEVIFWMRGPYMLKFLFALFLIALFTVTGFFTFSYFATGEYGGTGIMYTAIPFLS